VVLSEHCTAVGRDPGAVERTVNVGLVRDDDDLQQQFGRMAPYVRDGVLVLGDGAAHLVDQVGAYVEAGADGVIVALRSPCDLEALEVVADQVLPAFAP
jgi:hypothetical protein